MGDHKGHSHSHDHSHGGLGHDHASHASVRSLRFALVLTAALLVAEVVGGLLSNSIALLADAGHMLTDVAALGLSLFVAWFSRQPAAGQKSYGYLRWEILAAFLNGAALLVISAAIIFESIMRLRSPEHIAGGLMLTIAVAGLIINVISARMLHSGSQSSMNVRGAYLHVLGDLLACVGAVLALLSFPTPRCLPAAPYTSFLTPA